MLSSPKILESKACLICGGFMAHRTFLDLSVGTTNVYTCESCCDLRPYTRYVCTYEEGKCISEQIILKIDEENYILGYNTKKNLTYLSKIVPFIDLDKDPDYVTNDICVINSIIEWYDVLSAYNVITRLLNIKAFS